MIPKRVIRSVNFVEDAVFVEFFSPADDIKANGVIINHSIAVPTGESYDDEIEALTDAVFALLEDVLEDIPGLEPADLSPPEEEDDEE